MPVFIIEYTLTGNVVVPTPEVKKDTIKSSQDNVKAIKKAAIIPGLTVGITISLNAWKGVAPKSIAAFSKFESIWLNRVKMISEVYDILKVTCASNTE